MNQGKIGVVDVKLAARIRKKYPLAAEKLAQRAEQYNNGVAMARRLRAEGKVLIIAQIYASPVFFGSSAFVPAEFISR